MILNLGNNLVFDTYLLILTLFSNSGYPAETNHKNFFPYLIDKSLTEDGFYLLTVSRNYSVGKGITYNFNEPTTGVQPLVLFVYSAIFKFSQFINADQFLTLRFILLFSFLLLFILRSQIISLINEIYPHLSTSTVSLTSTLFVFFNLDLFIQYSNGLETGLYLTLITISVRYTYKIYSRNDVKMMELLFIGILFGITSLARIDFLIVSAVIYLLLLYKRKIIITQLFFIAFIHLLIISPWLIYIYKITGNMVQSSASAQMSFLNIDNLTDRFYWLFKALLQNGTPLLLTMDYDIILGLLVVLILLFIFIKRSLLSPLVKSKGGRFIILYWGIAFLILSIFYFFFSYATYFYIRYTSPLQIIFLLFFIPALSIIIDRNIIRKNYLITFAVLAFFLQAILYFHNGKLGVPQNLRISFIKNNFDENIKIGSYQSGVTGFFCDNVINMDGKINHTITRYRGKNNLARYLDSLNIGGLIEWGGFENEYPKKYFEENWELFSPDIGDGLTRCYRRKIKL